VNQPLLIQLRGAHFGQLAQACHQGAQVLLGFGGQAQRFGLLDFGIPGDHGRVDAIGLFQPAHAFGELAHRARVQDGDAQTLFREQGKSLLLVPAGGFHGHQLGPMRLAECRQFGNAFGVVGERVGRALLADASFQRIFRNIHSTNDPRHGNLPCMFE